MIVIIVTAYFKHIFESNMLSILNQIGIGLPLSNLITFLIHGNELNDKMRPRGNLLIETQRKQN